MCINFLYIYLICKYHVYQFFVYYVIDVVFKTLHTYPKNEYSHIYQIFLSYLSCLFIFYDFPSLFYL